MANNLHISYDLDNPGQNYDELAEKIRSLGSWAKIQKSFWYVQSSLSASEARDVLLEVMDVNDSLYVVDASNNVAAWRGLPDNASSHIKDRWHT